MKKAIQSIAMLLLVAGMLVSCSKKDDSNKVVAPTYASTQGVVTGTSGAVFSTSGSSNVFKRVVDTVTIKATISTAAGAASQLYLAFEKPAVGTFSFGDVFDHITDLSYQVTSVALYYYEDINAAGTLIIHDFAVKSGTYTITYVSATGITGTYSFTGNDYNNNGDAPVTISGTFSGNF